MCSIGTESAATKVTKAQNKIEAKDKLLRFVPYKLQVFAVTLA
jgi:hypothetical protein